MPRVRRRCCGRRRQRLTDAVCPSVAEQLQRIVLKDALGLRVASLVDVQGPDVVQSRGHRVVVRAQRNLLNAHSFLEILQSFRVLSHRL